VILSCMCSSSDPSPTHQVTLKVKRTDFVVTQHSVSLGSLKYVSQAGDLLPIVLKVGALPDYKSCPDI
jgi:hypothetical protein